jgi:hypothetical protein
MGVTGDGSIEAPAAEARKVIPKPSTQARATPLFLILQLGNK